MNIFIYFHVFAISHWRILRTESVSCFKHFNLAALILLLYSHNLRKNVLKDTDSYSYNWKSYKSEYNSQ